MMIVILFLITVGTAFGNQVPIPEEKDRPLLAVVNIVNNTGQYKAFVAGMPDMLITELLENGNVNLVERTKIHTAMQALKLEASGLTEESKLQLGKWLGADGIIVGAFNKLDRKFRLDLRVINVSTGTITFAASSTKGYDRLLEIIPDVGRQLRNKLSPKKPVKPEITKNQHNPQKKKEFCSLKIEYKMIVGLFTQTDVPFQKVRIYIDGELVHTSRTINRLNTYFTIFDKKIPQGTYELMFVHGSIHSDGKWRNDLEQQPKSYLITCREGERITLQYRMRAEDRWNTFSDIKKKT